MPEEVALRKIQEWRDEQQQIRVQLCGHQVANESYVEDGLKILELANKAYSLYCDQPATEKARLLKIVQSNCAWDGVTARPAYKKPFDILVKGRQTKDWLPGQDSNLRPTG